jgi:hypothetical protein
MTRYKPCGFDFVLVEKLQQTLRADGASEQTPTDVACAVFAAIRAQPAYSCQLRNESELSMRTAYSVYVDSIRDENALLAHYC